MSGAVRPTVLTAERVTRHFRVGGFFARKHRVVHALDDVSVAIAGGETVGVVGESGCGKSTLGRCLIRLLEPTAGRVSLHGEDVAQILATDRQRFRRAVQIVFQDPYASFNPRRTIGQSLDDPLRIHGGGTRAERGERAADLMRQVGLPAEHLERYPHEISGGQRQRVAIARALAPRPEVIICDEAVSSLDVSVQAQIINLLRDIQAETGVALLFITHNLHLVQRIGHRILVMYLGQIVEEGDARTLATGFVHPYSSALFAAAPRVRRGKDGGPPTPRQTISGEVPSPIDPPSGCRFHTRCPLVQPACRSEMPELRDVAGRRVRCHRAEEIVEGMVAA